MPGSASSDAGDRVARRFLATGRVQGVFFRDSTRREAERLGLAGWVRNADDGSVEGLLEGPEGAVDDGLEFLRGGPGNASVDRLDVSPAEPSGAESFEIR
ncbi:acylphosphatase [Thermoleophilia bacterium SCSIO 60948]|nr:acylphosphatase [Thermoleophilia bacterium SCSIO 60948]